MPEFDPKALIERTIMKEPETFQPTPGGYDLRRPSTLVMSVLRKALRKKEEQETAALAAEAVAAKEEPIDAAIEQLDAIGTSAPIPINNPDLGLETTDVKVSVDQAPQAPSAPGPVKPKAVKMPKVEGATVAKAYDPEKKFKEPEYKETVAEAKEAKYVPPAAVNVKQQDIVLWKAYSTDPTPNNLKPLMTAMQPLIHSEVNRWKAAAPKPALHRQAQSLTLHAIKTYDPNKGAALGTHVMNRLKKLSRTAYQHQDLVRLPENKKLRSQALYNAESELKGELGRDPTNAELADRLGWSPKRVSDVQRSAVGEYVESMDVGGEMFSGIYGRDAADPVLDYVYYDLDPTDKQIFEHLTGYSGKPVMTMQQVAMKLGLTDSQVRTRKTRIIKKIKQAS
jgi:DNA-directed RNA polymerase specialized sigma subunit